jgi:hypothetical protein
LSYRAHPRTSSTLTIDKVKGRKVSADHKDTRDEQQAESGVFHDGEVNELAFLVLFKGLAFPVSKLANPLGSLAASFETSSEEKGERDQNDQVRNCYRNHGPTQTLCFQQPGHHGRHPEATYSSTAN